MPERPSALLVIAPGCPHCPAMLDRLAGLIKQGRLRRLEVVDASAEPAFAARHGVRSVPWTRIGPFELTGLVAPAELSDWTERADSGNGWSTYFAHLLEHQRLEEAAGHLQEQPARMLDLLGLLIDPDLPMGTRIGISALVEELAGSEILTQAVPELEQLTLSDLPQTRADACHFLALAGDRRSLPAVRRLLEDEQADVREIALETLAVLDEPVQDDQAPDAEY